MDYKQREHYKQIQLMSRTISMDEWWTPGFWVKIKKVGAGSAGACARRMPRVSLLYVSHSGPGRSLCSHPVRRNRRFMTLREA